MAKGQHLSRYQQGIVRRYYEQADTITMTKLQELVGEIYLAEGKKAQTLWERAREALLKTDTPAAVVETVVQGRDVKALAEIVAKARVPKR
jgi:hypothetical protein